MQTQGEYQVLAGGKDWSDGSTAQGTPRTAGSYQKLEGARKLPSLEPLREHDPAYTLISDFHLPNAERLDFYCFF